MSPEERTGGLEQGKYRFRARLMRTKRSAKRARSYD
jgi:hypothetical protein